MGLEIFKENSIEDKLKGLNFLVLTFISYLLKKVFFDLCDTDNSGNISQQELYNLLKRNILSHHEKLKLKHTGNE